MRPRLRDLLASAGAAALFVLSTSSVVVAAPAGGAGDDANQATGALSAAQVMGILRPRGSSATSAAAAVSPLTYRGGAVESGSPKVYISWWGPQWSAGFSTGGYSSAAAQAYVTGFFSNVGGSSWNNVDTQYCQGVALGTVNCGASGTHVTNPAAQLAGTWNDTSTLPSRIRQSDIASAAIRLMNHFGGYNANATYMVFSPTGHSMSGFATSWCAWHSVASSAGKQVAYAYMPYIPNAGTSCGMNFVNAANTTFGNGYFDGFSVVGGHEFAEAQTDPHTSNGSYGWLDASGAENGDKCAWSSASTNITLGANHYAVQPLWSNANSGCALSY